MAREEKTRQTKAGEPLIFADMTLIRATSFANEALTRNLPPDEGSQRRLPGLRRKLRTIAELG